MHPLAVRAVIASVQRRHAQGDCPTVSREALEEALLETERQRLSRTIANDPDDEPTAGGPCAHPTSRDP